MAWRKKAEKDPPRRKECDGSNVPLVKSAVKML